MSNGKSKMQELLLELLNNRTSPEKALLSLSSPFLKDEIHIGDDEHLLIFLGYMKFIMSRKPGGNVEGIWEDIMLKTLSHTLHINIPTMDIPIKFLAREYSPEVFTWIDQGMVLQIKIWLQKVLSTPIKCPNPYTRLELFGMLVLLSLREKIEWELLCETFIDSICSINPFHYYLSDIDDNLVLEIVDLSVNVEEMYGALMKIMKSDNIGTHHVTTFVSQMMKLIVVFTKRADYKPHVGTGMDSLSYCSYIATRPSLRPCLEEVVCDLTNTIINSKEENCYTILDRLYHRDELLLDAGIYTQQCNLPKLLLSRQVQGPRQVQQHALLLKDLKDLYDQAWKDE